MNPSYDFYPTYQQHAVAYTPSNLRAEFIRQFVQAHYQPELAVEQFISDAKKLYDESLTN